MALSDISMYIAREVKDISLVEARRIISNLEVEGRSDKRLINQCFRLPKLVSLSNLRHIST